MNLKPQTVYIPVIKPKGLYGLYLTRPIVNSGEEDKYCQKKENQICLSKEELVELFGKVFDGGIEFAKAKNTDDIHGTDYLKYTPTKEQIINNLFNQ